MSNQIADYIAPLQAKIRNNIFVQVEYTQNTDEIAFFQCLLEYGKELCELALGDLGTKLYNLANDVDLQHPEVLSGQFLSIISKEPDIGIKLQQFLKLYSLSEENKLSDITPLLSRYMVRRVFPDLKSGVESLKNQEIYLRLFKDSKRNKLRKRKTPQCVDSIDSLKKILAVWDACLGVEVYERFGNFYKQEVERIQKKAQTYKDLGFSSMYTEVINSIKEFEEISNDQYYGFQRLSLTDASILLGKMHGCTISKDMRVMIPACILGSYDFTSVEPKEKLLFDDRPDFRYCPTIYPPHYLKIPAGIQEIIDRLEAFPEANNKPIFDRFIVVVPGIDLTPDNFYTIYDTSKQLLQFDTLEQTKAALDTILIENKMVIPILLGEKNGKCFFVCFWE